MIMLVRWRNILVIEIVIDSKKAVVQHDKGKILKHPCNSGIGDTEPVTFCVQPAFYEERFFDHAGFQKYRVVLSGKLKAESSAHGGVNFNQVDTTNKKCIIGVINGKIRKMILLSGFKRNSMLCFN